MSELTEQQFIELVKKAEKDASDSIKRYKIKLALFALLGYAVIFTVLLILIALAGGSIGIAFFSSKLFMLLLKTKVIIFILAGIWLFLRALWVRFEPPSGYTLKREKYPKLFKEIDNLTKYLDALKIHQVILDNRFSASVIQTPRLGILGFQKNTLFLGLQLMMALSPQEMRAVLAHEFGHLSGNHSRFAGRIYRIRLAWYRIKESLESSKSFGAKLMKKFFNWYAPKFEAYSFAFARSNEFEADKISAELTSPEIAAKALINVHTTGSYIDQKYWDEFYKKADDMPRPPGAPYDGLADFIKTSPITGDDLTAEINKQMERKTHYADTHPSLKERLQAITNKEILPEPVQNSVAEAWLGKNYQNVMDHFDAEWSEENLQGWKNRYEYVTSTKKSLNEFNNKEPNDLNNDELWQYAMGTYEFVSEEAALPLYQAYQKRDPESIGAAYYIGKALIAQKDETALDHLRIAFKHPDTLENAANWGYAFLMEKGDEEKAQQWWEEALRASQAQNNASAERNNATEKDEYIPPEISNELLEKLKSQLAAHKNVKAAWLAQKVIKLTEEPVYIVAFKPKGIQFSYKRVMEDVAKSLDIEMQIFVVNLYGETDTLAKKVKKKGVRIL